MSPRYVDVDGHPVRLRESGPPDGVPVVLIHGIGRSLEDWQPTQDLLAAEHRVVSLDLPGFGLTRRMKGHWGLEGFTRAVVALLDLDSGYIRRSLELLPRQGPRTPWRLHQNWFLDRRLLLHGPVTDEVRFERAPTRERAGVAG